MVHASVRPSTMTRPLASSRTFSTGCGPKGLGPGPSGSTFASRSCTLSLYICSAHGLRHVLLIWNSKMQVVFFNVLGFAAIASQYPFETT